MDPTVIHQPVGGPREPHAAESLGRTTANAQIVVGDIPAQRPGFRPRAAVLAQLELASQGSSVVALTGTWGVGKTQLAAAYARARIVSGWRLIAWVNARDDASVLAGLAAVAEATGLSAYGSRRGAADTGQAVRRWLEADGRRCLLVFDDAADPGLLEPFVPAAGAARVLITAIGEPTADLGPSVRVEAFSAEEALTLLDGRTGLADEAGASAVAAELGHLPLALDQAAAVIAGQHRGYEAYLWKLQALPVEDYLVRGQDEEEQPYPPGVAGAVLLSLEAACAADLLGVNAGAMEFMAMLSPAAVRRDLLRAAGQEGILLGGRRRVAASMVDQALERLNERSLLGFSFDGQAVSVHGLVARVVRGRLARQGRFATAFRAAASALKASAEALAKPPDLAAVRELLSQATALLDNARKLPDDADETLVRMLMRLRFLALYQLIELGDGMPLAVATGEPLTADLEHLLGASHHDTLNAYDNLAAAYQAADRTAEAAVLLEQTLYERERLLGSDHPDSMRSRNDLARAYRETGRVADAVPLVERTLAARERELGADHPSTLASRNNLARAYQAAGRPAEAIPLFEQNVAACERLLGADHRNTLHARGNLAAAYRVTGRVAEEPAAEEPPARQVPAEEPPAEPVPAVQAPAEDASEEAIPLAGTEQSTPPEPAPETPAEAADRGPDEDAAREQTPEPEPEPEPVPASPRPEPASGPARSSSGRPARRRLRVLSLVAVFLTLLAAGGVTFAVSRHHAGHPSGRGGGQAGGAAADPAQMAAEWVSQQVSQSVIVACDPLMCSVLEARGVSASRLLVLRTTTPNPLGAEVVVATPTVRSQFGGRLDSVYAPSVIAGFGSGPDHVDVQVVARNGAAAYLSALRQDMAARKVAGIQLLANKRIEVTAQARTQLVAGEVDSRLLIMLPALAATHPIQILAFGESGPGASPGVPLCSADLSGSGRAAGMTDASYLSWLTSFVRAQLAPFSGSMAVLRQGDQSILRVEFARPSPLGLLTHG